MGHFQHLLGLETKHEVTASVEDWMHYIATAESRMVDVPIDNLHSFLDTRIGETHTRMDSPVILIDIDTHYAFRSVFHYSSLDVDDDAVVGWVEFQNTFEEKNLKVKKKRISGLVLRQKTSSL